MPSTSRSNSNSPMRNKISPDLSDEDEEDDISLQDLVAMETMEQENDEDEDEEDVEDSADDEDPLFTLASCTTANPLEPFVNAILRDRTESFECDSCGLHFPTHEAYVIHRTDVCRTKMSKNGGYKVKKSIAATFEGLAEVKSEASSLLSAADLGRSLEQPYPGTSGSNSFKFETDSQPVLGSCHQDHWKCNTCLVVFTTGLDLFRHQEELRDAQFKCNTCHLIFDDRKMVQSHRKEFHVASTSLGLTVSYLAFFGKKISLNFEVRAYYFPMRNKVAK